MFIQEDTVINNSSIYNCNICKTILKQEDDDIYTIVIKSSNDKVPKKRWYLCRKDYIKLCKYIENKGKKVKIYGIYDIKEKEQCIRVGTLEEIKKFLDLTVRELGRALKNNNLIRNKYKVCYLFKEWEVQKK